MTSSPRSTTIPLRFGYCIQSNSEDCRNRAHTVGIDVGKLTAVDEQTGERFIVRYEREDTYDAVIEPAQRVGIELEDG